MSNQSADAFRVWTAGIRKMLIEAGEKSAAARVDNYSFETFDAGWQASRREALDEAAKVCDELADGWNQTAQGATDGRYDFMAEAGDRCADEIRALSGSTEK